MRFPLGVSACIFTVFLGSITVFAVDDFLCPAYSGSAECRGVYACPGDTVVASACPDDGGSCAGEQYLSLRDDNNSEYGMNDGAGTQQCPSNPKCPKLSAPIPPSVGACQYFKVAEVCKGNVKGCSGQVHVTVQKVKPSPPPTPARKFAS
jgi:hypothetical protein